MGNNKAFLEFGKYVFLNIFAQIAFSCYTLMDTYFVSWKLKADGLSALNIAFPMFCIINGMGLMIGIGGGIKYSILRVRIGMMMRILFSRMRWFWELALLVCL